MLETIREYAFERLDRSGEADALRDRHAEVLAALAEAAAPHLASGQRGPWIERIALDQENLRTALRWSVESKQPIAGLRIVGALWMWYFLSFREGQTWVEALLPIATEDVPEVVRARALFTGSVTGWAACYGPAVRRFGLEGVALAHDLHSPVRLAYALSVIASNMPDAGERLHKHYAECLQAAAATGDSWLCAFARVCYAVAAAQLGDLATSCKQGRLAVDECPALCRR